MRWLGICLLVATASLSAQSAPDAPMPSVALPPELDRVLRDYESAWRAKDAAALAQLFAEDGFVLSNGKPPVRGRDEIRKAYADGGGPLALRALAYAVEGPVGYIIGAYRGSAESPDDGKFVLALKRSGERWLIAADIDNTNRRPSRAPAAPAPQ